MSAKAGSAIAKPTPVIPAKAGIQSLKQDGVRHNILDPSLRWDDGGVA
jgi:hypothetical protein